MKFVVLVVALMTTFAWSPADGVSIKNIAENEEQLSELRQARVRRDTLSKQPNKPEKRTFRLLV
jgi:hypothetical protein